MPTMANITVKKNDGTTDIIYTGVQPSSGDGAPAMWRQEDLTLPYGMRPTLSIVSTWNGPRTARRVEGTYSAPFTYTDSTTGLKMSKDKIPLKVTGTFPSQISDSAIQEAVAQCFNLFASALVKSQFATQFAAS